MKSWLSLLLMSVLGSTGCVNVISTTNPFACDPFHTDADRIEQYAEMVTTDTAPAVRAWVREADRVCRANNELRNY